MIPVDVPGQNIPTMADYVPSGSNYPKDFRILDCWQCFEAQGKVCMDKDHQSLIQHIETTKSSAIFCCKQDYNEGYCKDGSKHTDQAGGEIEMVCSPGSFNPGKSGTFGGVVSTDLRNY